MRSYFGGENDAAEVVEPLGRMVVLKGAFFCFGGCGTGGLVVKGGGGEGLGGVT